MPQKRNPVVLEHLRARISRMLGQAHGVVIQCHNIPFGDTQDIEDEIFPALFGSLETACEILQLYAAVMVTLKVNVGHLRNRAIDGFTTVTELADTLVREAGLPFRQAHRVVSGMVSHALENNLAPTDLDADLMRHVSAQVLSQEITLPDEIIQRALDPITFVNVRMTPGGAAPAATDAVLQLQASCLEDDRRWFDNETRRLVEAETALREEMQAALAAS
jgi:argininosuccinate lyase